MQSNENTTPNIILDDLLNTSIGSSHRYLTINNITTREIKTKYGDIKQKLNLEVEEISSGKKFNISDAYVNITQASNSKEELADWAIQGLWITMNKGKNGENVLSPTCALSKVLNYYRCESIKDLLGIEVTAFPDPNNFLTLIACNLPDTEGEVFKTLNKYK